MPGNFKPDTTKTDTRIDTGVQGARYLISGLVLSLFVWIVSYNFEAREEQQQFEDVAQRAHQISIFFERHVIDLFQYGDAYLKLVRREYLRNRNLDDIKSLMLEVPLDTSIASHITVLNAEGTPVFISGHELKPGVTARDRDYFKFQQQASGDELHISRLHKGRNSGILIVRLVRRFENAEGEFGGVIFLALEASHMTGFFNSMQIGPNSSATLVGNDRYVRSRSSYGPKGPGQNISGSQLWQRLEENRVGHYLQTSVVDNVTRHYAYRQVPGFPLIVAIGLSIEDFQQGIAISRFNQYSIALLLTLFIAVTTLFFFRQRQLLLQIESKNQELEQHSDEIEAKNVELQGQNAELERFNYTVSHDLKAPLVTIKGFLGLLGKDFETRKPESIRHDIAQIDEAADKMAQLLDELLELSRVGRQINAQENLNLNLLVEDAIDRVSMQIDDRGVDLLIADNMPEIYADQGRMLEVFQNLVDNAIKFMGDQAKPVIEIGASRQNGSVSCFVRDNGIGIEPRYQEQIFELFERLGTGVEGTGIGLALVKRIIEVHGGQIWVESEGNGKGSTFRFTLPANQHAKLLG